MKRFAWFAVALVMLVGLCPTVSALKGTSGDFTYVTLSDNSAWIDSYSGSATSLTIPSTIDGYTVVKISGQAFEKCQTLQSVIIPEGITTIGDQAFKDCTALETISVPESVETIESNAFDNTAFYNNECNWDENVLYLGGHLLEARNGVGPDYAIKEGTKTVVEDAFSYCRTLETITFPDSVTAIGQGAFSQCTSLKSAELSDGVTEIENSTFSQCSALEQVTLPKDLTAIWDSVFEDCTSLKSITFPDSLYRIGIGAFHSCTALERVTIPAATTWIGSLAFFKCTSLQSFTVSSDNTAFTDIGGVLFEKNRQTLIQYPAGKPSVSYKVPDGTKWICEEAFNYAEHLRQIILPPSVSYIGDWAFYSCTGLKSIAMADAIKEIGNYAFLFCSSLTDVYYSGDESQWNAVTIGSDNTSLENAVIHFETEAKEIGDVNGDGRVNMVDSIVLFATLSGRRTATDTLNTWGDYTGDGKVNMADAVNLFRYVSGRT